MVREFLTILPLLKKDCLVLIDDTPINEDFALPVHNDEFVQQWRKVNKNGFPPGKGSLIKQYIEFNSIGKIIDININYLSKSN